VGEGTNKTSDPTRRRSIIPTPSLPKSAESIPESQAIADRAEEGKRATRDELEVMICYGLWTEQVMTLSTRYRQDPRFVLEDCAL
jgi:NAD-specific glutamate dehydrogenase